jgi:hypothetical protein
MNENQNWTVSEHIASISYQAGFSFDEERVYTNDVIDLTEYNKPIKMKNVCCQNNIFENKDEFGEYVERNFTECALADYDGMIPIIRDAVITAYNNRVEQNVLTDKDQELIKRIISVQLFRSPNSLTSAKFEMGTFLTAVFPPLQKHRAEAIAQRMLLPVKNRDTGEVIQSIEQTPILNMIYSQIKQMDIAIGFTEKDSLISCDRPVCAESDGENKFGFPNITFIGFPLTSRLLVCLYQKGSQPYIVNKFFQLREEEIAYSNREIARKTHRHIISKCPIAPNQVDDYISINKREKLEKDEMSNKTTLSISKKSLNELIKSGDVTSGKTTRSCNKKTIVIDTEKINVTYHDNDLYDTKNGDIWFYTTSHHIDAEYLYFQLVCYSLEAKEHNKSLEWIMSQPLLIPDIDTQEYSKSLIHLCEDPYVLIEGLYKSICVTLANMNKNGLCEGHKNEQT